MPRGPVQTGILLVDKPAGMTSHDVVSRVRRAFGQREVGHAGTLDPAATGLLVMALGDATRLLRFVEAAEKAYAGTVRLGRATTTWDAEGDTTEEVAAPRDIDPAALEAALASLTGTITQSVPAFSAVKVDGVRAYARARKGEAVEVPKREVTVSSIAAVRVAPPDIDIVATVSKGTYVRTLAVDLGAKLGFPAHLCALRRTRIGRFSVDAAYPLESLEGAQLLPAADACLHLVEIRIDLRALDDVRHGRALSAEAVLGGASGDFAADASLRIVAPDGSLAAIAEARASREALASFAPRDAAVRYACVLAK